MARVRRYGPRAPEFEMARSDRPSFDADVDFGFSRVPLGEKQRLVDGVFHAVAGRYDLMNDLMSAGLHRVWKDVLVGMVAPSRTRPFRHLDVAGGTGDVAFRIADAGGRETHVTVSDINPAMLAVGADRAAKRSHPGQLDFVEANAEELPFPDNSFDAYTIAFGIRNVPRRSVALSEALRVLKRGGRFLCLEFSDVDVPVMDAIYRAYSFTAIPAMGRAVTGDGQPYRYLVESIAQFPPAELFRDEIADAGFRRASFTRLTGGVVAIHSGWKL
jgi:demethylmenaquinone methyltransferase/2-methoxy-6-polyprenyl-1,4-benzoquinol methylase